MESCRYSEWAEKFRLLYRAFVLKIAKLADAKKILDVECGSGILIDELSRVFDKAEIYGIDVNKDFCKMSNAVLGDARKLPFKSEAFDLITFSYSLHDVGLPTILEARGCLKEGGALAIRDLNSEMPEIVKNVTLRCLEENISKAYAEKIKRAIENFPKPDSIAKFVGDFF